MQNFLKLIFLAVMLVFAQGAHAEEGGKIILDIQDVSDDSFIPDYGAVFQKYIEDVKIYDKKYPGQSIEEDFQDDIAENNPDFSRKTVATDESFIRIGVRSMRLFNTIKDKIRQFMLDNDIPLMVAPEQYESGDAEVYRESEHPLVIPDFKKVVAYSDSPRDIAAVDNRISLAVSGKSLFQRRSELKKAVLEGDWKKVFSYGLFDGRELDDNRGITPWTGNDQLKIRMLASQTALGDSREVSGALQILVHQGNFLLLKKYLQYGTLHVDFGASENVEKLELNWPLPQRYVREDKTLVGYVGSIIVPFRLEVKDSSQPLRLIANLSGTTCGNNLCTTQDITSNLPLEPGQAGESRIASYLRLAEMYAPQSQNPDLTVSGLWVEEAESSALPSIIRVELQARKNPADFDIYIDSPDGIEFDRPLIRIDRGKIIARFKSLGTGQSLVGRNFTISARLNNDVSIRQSLTAKNLSLFDTEGSRLSLGMIWFALLGGFLLNLMPCVFPVLSLKLLSFTQFGGTNTEKVRRGFMLNILGIFTAFAIIVGALTAMKLAGSAVGWGMQFQNIYFLTLMIFVIAFFLAHVWGLVNFRTPQIINQVLDSRKKQDYLLHYLTGLFIVLLSTPCTAPYLGTAIGFALAGTIGDTVAVMSAVALGLSAPYLIFAFFPSLAFYMPAPGRWMRHISRIMALMLFLTLIWLLNVLGAQTSGSLIFRFCVFLVFFMLILWFRKLLIETVDQQSAEFEILRRTKLFFNSVVVVVVASILVWAMYDASAVYRQRRHEIAATVHSGFTVYQDIQAAVDLGQVVLVRIGADWCLTCKYNDFTVFETSLTKEMLENNRVKVVDIDWTNYNPDVLKFMEKFGRRGLPFYVIFSPRIPDGMVLPEVVNDLEFRQLIENLRY